MLPCGEVGGEDFGPGLVGRDADVRRAAAFAREADAIQKCAEFLEVALADFRRTREQAALRFEADEFDISLKRKRHFVRVEHLKDDHLVPDEAQVLDATDEFVLVVEKIAHEHHDPAASRLAREIVERLGNGGGLRGIERAEHGADRVDFREAVRARDVLARLVVEDRHCGGVALEEDEIREARGHHFCIVELAHRTGAVAHGLAAIEQQVRHEVRLLLVLLDVVAVAAPEHLPIEMPRVVAGDVFAVLRKLDRKSAERRLVRTGHVALDNRARLEAEILGLLDRLGIEQRRQGGFRGGAGHRAESCMCAEIFRGEKCSVLSSQFSVFSFARHRKSEH